MAFSACFPTAGNGNSDSEPMANVEVIMRNLLIGNMNREPQTYSCHIDKESNSHSHAIQMQAKTFKWYNLYHWLQCKAGSGGGNTAYSILYTWIEMYNIPYCGDLDKYIRSKATVVHIHFILLTSS